MLLPSRSSIRSTVPEAQPLKLSLPDTVMRCWSALDPSFCDLVSRAFSAHDTSCTTVRARKSSSCHAPTTAVPSLRRRHSHSCLEPSNQVKLAAIEGLELDNLPQNTERPLYEPHGKYESLSGKCISDVCELSVLGTGTNCAVYIKSATVVKKSSAEPVDELTYVCKTWQRQKMPAWNGFFAELALYKSSQHLRSLQGFVVPAIIGVYIGDSGVNVAMEPPHPIWWFEATASMPDILKAKVVAAYEQIHARGVLHGDVARRHMLIGADTRATIIDFQGSSACVGNDDVGLSSASDDMFAMEMRRVRYVLDFEGARAQEQAKTRREVARRARNKATYREVQMRRANGLPYRDLVKVSKHPDDRAVAPISPDTLEEWNTDTLHVSRRIIMPGVSVEELAESVVDFVRMLDELQEEEATWSTVATSPGSVRSTCSPPPLSARLLRPSIDPKAAFSSFTPRADTISQPPCRDKESSVRIDPLSSNSNDKKDFPLVTVCAHAGPSQKEHDPISEEKTGVSGFPSPVHSLVHDPKSIDGGGQDKSADSTVVMGSEAKIAPAVLSRETRDGRLIAIDELEPSGIGGRKDETEPSRTTPVKRKAEDDSGGATICDTSPAKRPKIA